MAEGMVRAYGSWKSPITSELITSGTVRLGQVMLDSVDTYWVEMRPTEAGRNIVVRLNDSREATDMILPPFNARTLVHEYGGGAYLVHDGVLYFSNFTDQRIYRIGENVDPQPITPEGGFRYADAIVDTRRNRLICVREDHTQNGEAVNSIVAVDLGGEGEVTVLVSGNDFYASPRLSGDGARLTWLTWNHPNMPWDGTELWTADMDKSGDPVNPDKIAGGADESIFQPEWSPEGILYFVSDRTNWWNIYRLDGGKVEPVTSLDAEFGLPQWIFGMSTYAFESNDRIICTYSQNGTGRLAQIDTGSCRLENIDTPYTSFGFLRAAPGKAVFIAGSSEAFTAVVSLDLDTMETTVLRRSSNVTVDPGYISPPRAIEFPTENGLTAHAIFYAPKNKDFQAPPDEKPPLVVMSHGGPTGSSSSTLNLSIQYWTSRGIGVVDVNYGGSTGYGRDYRERLKGQWGIVDIDDCANAARYLVDCGEADGKRLAIRGGSAGGYTTLGALTFKDVFQAGASYYGVSDLEALAKETHKFESRYLDGLIGPYPERRYLYIERSPINHVERISCPVILFQGLDDKIVPPNQAEKIVEALDTRGFPVAYVPFEGEQHGFRNAVNIKRALDAELYFYSRIFDFEPADSIEPVHIVNLNGDEAPF